MSRTRRFWYMRYSPNNLAIEVVIAPGSWRQMSDPSDWFLHEERLYGLTQGPLIPPNSSRRFGIRRTLTFHPATGLGWPMISCPLPKNGYREAQQHRRILRDRLVSMNLLFTLLHIMHDDIDTESQPFDLVWLGPGPSSGSWLDCRLSTQAGVELSQASDLWLSATANMRDAYTYLGGPSESLSRIGAHWSDGMLSVACRETMLTAAYEPTHYPETDSEPHWPTMTATTKDPADLLVLLVGLATIDYFLTLRRRQRAA